MYVVCVDAALLGCTDATTKVRKKLKEASGDGCKKIRPLPFGKRPDFNV